jgi:hypothetical protein
MSVKKNNIAKKRRNGLMVSNDPYARAYQRVVAEPQLKKYKNIILEDYGQYDNDHWEWIVSATIKEITEWAKNNV